jgi:hypothetical protein
MPGRFFELAVRARRFSLRLAFMIDVAYIGLGALGGAALGRAAPSIAPPSQHPSRACVADAGQRLH